MTEKRPPGRPVKLTEEVRRKVLEAIELGLYPSQAAELCGVNRATLSRHKKADVEFRNAIKAAEAKAQSTYLRRIKRSSTKSWTAAAWILERRWPDLWALRKPKDESSTSANDLASVVRAIVDSAREVTVEPNG